MIKVKSWFNKWKFVDKSKYNIIPQSEMKRHFVLSKKQYEESEKLYKEEKRTISYEFYPCGGIGWGVKIHDMKTNETFNITDTSVW